MRTDHVHGGSVGHGRRAGRAESLCGLIDEFVSVHADGSFHLTNVVEVGGLGYGRDGSYRYYMSERVIDNDPKGVGPAIMAGLQVAELAKPQP